MAKNNEIEKKNLIFLKTIFLIFLAVQEPEDVISKRTIDFKGKRIHLI